MKKTSFFFLLIFGTLFKGFGQDSLQVALQVGHQVVGNYSSAPKVYAVSNNDRWVVTANPDEHTLIVWDISSAKIYATYQVNFNISTAVFLNNNEDVLINYSLVFNIHRGKVIRKLPEPASGGGEVSIDTRFSMQTNDLVYTATQKKRPGQGAGGTVQRLSERFLYR